MKNYPSMMKNYPPTMKNYPSMMKNYPLHNEKLTKNKGIEFFLFSNPLQPNVVDL